MHRHQDMREEMKHYNFHMALWLSSQPFCSTHSVALRGASSHHVRLATPVHWLETESSPWIPRSTCPWQKQNLSEKNKYKTLLLWVFSRGPQMFLCGITTSSVMAQDIPGCHRHGLRCSMRTRDRALILFWATWTGISATVVTAATSKAVTGHFHSKRRLPVSMVLNCLRPPVSSA